MGWVSQTFSHWLRRQAKHHPTHDCHCPFTVGLLNPLSNSSFSKPGTSGSTSAYVTCVPRGVG